MNQRTPGRRGAAALRWSTIFAALLVCEATAVAQCSPQFVGRRPLPGVDQPIHASVMWDPDGAGPASPKLVLGGYFLNAGTVRTNRVVTYDPATKQWAPLGSGFWGSSGVVTSIVVGPNGTLYAAGSFTNPGSSAGISNVARWTGSSWAAVGGGTDGLVTAMLVLPNGDLVVGGNFTSAGGVAAARVARWDGAAWHPFGPGLPGASVLSLGVFGGDLVVGGAFNAVAGSKSIVRWNGAAWQGLGGGASLFGGAGRVTGLSNYANGDLFAVGRFDAAGSTSAGNAARWNGTTWQAVGALPNEAQSVTMLPGDVPVVGLLNGAQKVFAWSGANWVPFSVSLVPGPDSFSPRTLTRLPSGELFVGGNLGGLGAYPDTYLAFHGLRVQQGGAWSRLGDEDPGVVLCLAALPGGGYIAGGSFRSLLGVQASRIARWDGAAWHPLGAGLDGDVRDLLRLPNGDLVARGSFASAGGVAVQGIARWDGSAWHALPGAGNAFPTAMVASPAGQLVAAGSFGVARWDGAAWNPIAPVPVLAPQAIAYLGNGDLVSGHSNGVSRWTGSFWQPLGAALPSAPTVLHAAGGSLFAGQYSPHGLRRWDGASWQSLGGVVGVWGMADTANGDLIVVGQGGVSGLSTPGIARFDGVAWHAVDQGLHGAATDVVALANGEFEVCGPFFGAGAVATWSLARLSSTCPATAQASPTACVGPAGAMPLFAEQFPWLGGTLRTRCSGMANSSIALTVASHGGVPLPLALAVGSALPGCDIVTPLDDVWIAPISPAGECVTTIPIPSAPALAGAGFWLQHAQLGFDASGTWTSTSSSNALRAVLGSFGF